MNKIVIYFGLFSIITFNCRGQLNEDFKIIDEFSNEIKLPVSNIKELPYDQEVNKYLLNTVLFEHQKERAVLYDEKNSLFRVTTYGKIPEMPMIWKTWDESRTKRIEKVFETKVYVVGKLNLDPSYKVLISRVLGFEKSYIDLYVFDKEGKLKSLLNLYEAEYERKGEPAVIETEYITSTITTSGIIDWQEDRFDVQTKRKYELQPDGIFKIIFQESVGEFEY